jgi:rod shape-determining protein MreD
MKKIIFSLFFFFILVLVQTSFLPHFVSHLNLVLLFLIISLFFGKGKNDYIIGLIAGIYLDIYSGYFFGIYILVALVITALIRRLKYILDQGLVSYLIISFVILLIYQLIFLILGARFSFVTLLFNFLFLVLWLGIRHLYDSIKETIT